MYDVAAGVTRVPSEIDMANGHLLHGKEIRDETHRVVKVHGDSRRETLRDGWKVLVDLKKRNPRNNEIVAMDRR